MSTHADDGFVPEWTLGDRLRKARNRTGLTTRDFAEAIGVSHGTVTNAEGDKRAVRRITLNAWALATGVSVRWLATGEGQVNATPPDRTQVPPRGGHAHHSLPRLDSNQQPSGYPFSLVSAA